MDSQLMNEAKGLVSGTVDTSMTYMNLGFTLASALAWHESAKILVKQFINKGNNRTSSLIVYPVAVTLMAILVFRMSRLVNPSAKRPIVVPVVSA